MTLGVVAALVSCQKSEVSEVSTANSVSFYSTINEMTRVNGNSFESGDQISVFALEGETSFAENVAYLYTGSLFASSSPITYASSDQLLSFYAIYPYSDSAATAFDFEIATDQTTDVESSDLLVASVADSHELTPDLQFKHKFAKINVNVEGVEDVEVAVTAMNLVSCDVVADTYEGSGNTTAITPVVTGEGSYSAIVAPQTIYSTGVFVSVSFNGTTVSWVPESNIEIKSGYMYTCSVSIESGEVTFAGMIESWNDGGDLSGDIEEAADGTYLADFSATSYPEEDVWVISDTTAQTADFLGFSAALVALESSGRQISVEFPNLESIPSDAMFGDASAASISASVLVSITADVATSIGESAFSGASKLATLNAPMVVSVGSYAFSSCKSLSTVSLPLAETVGMYAFYNCSSLETIDAEAVLSVDYYGFALSGLKAINMPVATTLGESAFRDCNSLVDVNLPLASDIGKAAFITNDALVSISLPSAVTLSSGVFSACESLESVDLPVATVVGYELCSWAEKVSTVNMPGVTALENFALWHCDLKTLTLATLDGCKLTSIASNALYTTSDVNLTLGIENADLVDGNTLTVGDFSSTFASITLVGESASGESRLAEINATTYPSGDVWVITDTTGVSSDFAGLRDALNSVYEADPTRMIELEFPNLEAAPDNTLYVYETYENNLNVISIDLPVATSVGEWSFKNCDALKSISLPSVTSVGEYAFNECDAIESVYLPSATNIQAFSFYSCDSLVSFEAPLAVTTGDGVFFYSSKLSSIVLPSATTFGDFGFGYCSALTNLELATAEGAVFESFHTRAFSGTTTSKITLTTGSANSEFVNGSLLTVGDFSATFGSIVVEGAGTPTGDYTLSTFSATSYPSDDTWVILDATAESSDDFEGLRAALSAVNTEDATRMISLEFPALESVPANAIYVKADDFNKKNSNIISVSLPLATTIGEEAFKNCGAMTSFSTPNAVTIGNSAFYYASAIAEIDLPNAITIGEYAFGGCSVVPSVYLPVATTIGASSFFACSAIALFDAPEVTTTGMMSLGFCNALTTLKLATAADATLASVDSNTFMGSYPANIDLVVGASNTQFVNGTTITVGAFSATFKSITVAE